MLLRGISCPNILMIFFVVVVAVVKWLVVVEFVVIVGILALVVYFREVMMISLPELTHCGGAGWDQCHHSQRD